MPIDIVFRHCFQPASLKDKNGKEKYYYPSKREELVEDALRKFAVEGQGLFLDDAAGVTFTLHQLQQKLMNNGHSYSKDQIKDVILNYKIDKTLDPEQRNNAAV